MNDVEAKLLTLAILILLTVAFGSLPYFLVLRRSHSVFSSRFREIALACLNCFAGGVFLGTLLLHLMPEGEEEFESYKGNVGWDTEFPFFNIFIFGGLFLVALMEHFTHACLHQEHSHDYNFNHENSDEDAAVIQISQKNRSRYGSVEYHHHDHNNHAHHGTVTSKSSLGSEFSDGASVHVRKPSDCPPGPHCDPAETHQGPERLHHQAHGFQAFLLLIALSFHTIFDGLAVGLQKGSNEVWAVFTAIALHKSVIAFCLGFEMFKKYVENPWRAFLWMCMFSIMSPLGIALGIGLEEGDINENAKSLASSILQGVAAGVFLYVTFLEILCSYMGHGCVRGSKFVYYVCTATGFGVMAVVKALDKD